MRAGMSQWTMLELGKVRSQTSQHSAVTLIVFAPRGRRLLVDRPKGLQFHRLEQGGPEVRAPPTRMTAREVAPHRVTHPFRVVGPQRGRPKPQVPVEVVGHLVGPRGGFARPRAAAAPHVNGLNLAEPPRPHVLDDADVVTGLVAHLRSALLLEGQSGNGPGFVDRAGQSLLAEHVQPGTQGVSRRRGVVVVGRGDDHGVELRAHLVDHQAEVLEFRDVGLEIEGLGGLLLVHVAQGGDAGAHLLAHRRPSLVGDKARAAPAHAHHGHLNPLVGRIAEGLAVRQEQRGGGRRRSQKSSSRQASLRRRTLLVSSVLRSRHGMLPVNAGLVPGRGDKVRGPGFARGI